MLTTSTDKPNNNRSDNKTTKVDRFLLLGLSTSEKYYVACFCCLHLMQSRASILWLLNFQVGWSVTQCENVLRGVTKK